MTSCTLGDGARLKLRTIPEMPYKAISRREFLARAIATSALPAPLSRSQPYLSAPAIIVSAQERPSITHGVSSGDVGSGRAVIWSRADQPARMLVEYSTTESFQQSQRATGSIARPETGFTARVELTDHPRGQRILYRVTFENVSEKKRISEAQSGSFMSEPIDGTAATIAWSADTAGQGWGINLDWGGMRLYETIRRAKPDVFIHCGDTVYADAPLPPEIPLDDGTVWKNVVTDAKSRVAESLDDFRGNHLYNLLDDNVRRLNAEVSQVVTWDDHEVRDNWYPGRSLDKDDRYREKNTNRLARRARQAFVEHYPIRRAALVGPLFRALRYGPIEIFVLDLRTHRGPNTTNRNPVPGSTGQCLDQSNGDGCASDSSDPPPCGK